MISNSGYRLVGLRPSGFLSPLFVGVFHIKILCLIAYFFISTYILIDDISNLMIDWLVDYQGYWVSYLGGCGCYTYNQLLFSLTTLKISFDWFVGIVIEFVRLVIKLVIVIPNLSIYISNIKNYIVFIPKQL